MDDKPHHEPVADFEPPITSEAELDTGLPVPAEAVHLRIRDSIARIEARKNAV